MNSLIWNDDPTRSRSSCLIPVTAVIGLTAGDLPEDEKAMTIAGASVVINKNEVLHALYPVIVNAVKQIKKLV